MNKSLLLLLLLSPQLHAQKPEENKSIEVVDIDLSTEQSSTVDKTSAVETVSKTTRKLKLKITMYAALGSFLTGGAALIWKLAKK